jgi:hypothetical protein
MSYVNATPETMTAAATDLATIASDVSAAHTAAAPPTVALVPAAADEVSESIAHLFSQYGGGFQALAGKASVFHDQFVQNLKASASLYTSAEAANGAALKVPPIVSTLTADVRALLASLPPQVQNTLADLEGFVVAPLLLGFLIAAFLFATVEVAIEKLLAQFGL